MPVNLPAALPANLSYQVARLAPNGSPLAWGVLRNGALISEHPTLAAAQAEAIDLRDIASDLGFESRRVRRALADHSLAARAIESAPAYLRYTI